jgi:PEP-CTERM motif
MNISVFASKRLHAALFTATTALFVAAPAAQAAIVSVNLTSSPIAITNNIDGVYLNVVTGVSGATSAAVPGYDINPYNNNAGLTFYGNATPNGILATGTPGTSAETTALSFGALISSAGQFNQFQTRGTAFQTPGTRYLGFKFLNETTGVSNFGWLQVVSGGLPSPNGGFPALITAYGYENAGLSITAGAVAAIPEASTWALFAVGLVGLGLRGMKRRQGA